MKVKLDAEAVAAIEAALNRGKDIWIYRNKTGVVVTEQTRKVTYSTARQTEQ